MFSIKVKQKKTTLKCCIESLEFMYKLLFKI